MASDYYKAKRVHIFLNGYPQSKSFLIHPKCRLGWTAILDCFSKKLKPKFGAIRVLKTIDGRRVVESFSELQHEGKYVACGNGHFKSIRGGYVSIPDDYTNTKTCNEYYPAKNLSADERKRYPCLIATMRKGRTIIYVFANGKKTDPKKIVFIKSDYDVWESMLKHIGIILDIPEGVKGLCTVFGQPICSPYELQHGGYYVAIPYSAVYKSVRYLSSQRSKSWYESSPMVTQDVYICAAKTCTDIDGVFRKRRRKSTKVRDNSTDGISPSHGTLENRVKIVGTAIRKKKEKEEIEAETSESNLESNFVRFRATGYPGSNYFKALNKVYDDDSDSQGSEGEDDDELMDQAHPVSEIVQDEKSTQTSTVFFDANFGEDNAILLNNRKYYLVPEEEFKKLGDPDTSGWYTELFSEYCRKFFGYTEEDRKEVQSLAGAVVGLIIEISEKIANRVLYGKSTSNVGVSFSREVIDQKPPSPDGSDEKSEISSRTNLSVKRSVRLSLPNIEIEALHDEFCPLTPSHPFDINLDEIEDDTGALRQQHSLLKHLRRDSVGVKLNEMLQDEDDDEYNAFKNAFENEGEDDEDKLDILEDLGIMTENYETTESVHEEEFGEKENIVENIIFEDPSGDMSTEYRDIDDHNNTEREDNFEDEVEPKGIIKKNSNNMNSVQADPRYTPTQESDFFLQPLDDETSREKMKLPISERRNHRSETESYDDTDNTWEKSVKRVLRNDFQEETSFQSPNSESISNGRDCCEGECTPDIQEKRRSLIQFLRSKIENQLFEKLNP